MLLFLSSVFFFSAKYSRNKIPYELADIKLVTSRLDLGQPWRNVGPGLGPNFFERFSANGKRRHFFDFSSIDVFFERS